MAYEVLKDLAIIIVFAKFFGLVARKCKAPQVVGEIIAGLLIGPCLLGIVQQTDFITQMAEIGVILLMFSAGLETVSMYDAKEFYFAADMNMDGHITSADARLILRTAAGLEKEQTIGFSCANYWFDFA